jgi:hypothetical protein
VRWIWVPGYVWGPAWVTWIYNDFYIGWAPLPSTFRFHRHHGFTGHPVTVDHNRYVFVSAEHMTANNLGRVKMPVEKSIEILRASKSLTTITVENNHIINQGPDLSRIEKIKLNPTPVEKFSHAQVKPRAIELSDQVTEVEVVSPKINRKEAGSIIKNYEPQERSARADRESQFKQEHKTQPNPTNPKEINQREQYKVERKKQEQIERSRQQVEQNKQIQQQKHQEKDLEKLRQQQQKQEQNNNLNKTHKHQEKQQQRVDPKQGKRQEP